MYGRTGKITSTLSSVICDICGRVCYDEDVLAYHNKIDHRFFIQQAATRGGASKSIHSPPEACGAKRHSFCLPQFSDLSPYPKM